MGSYVPSTAEQRSLMLKAVGVPSFEALYRDVPENMRLEEGALNIPSGISEMELRAFMQATSDKNKVSQLSQHQNTL